MTYIYTEHDYLAHHGIKGMRWGVRRYQNEDGSLKSAGKKRYSSDVDDEAAKKEQRKKTLKKVAIGTAAVAGVLAIAGGIAYSKAKYDKNIKLGALAADEARTARKQLMMADRTLLATRDAERSAANEYDRVKRYTDTHMDLEARKELTKAQSRLTRAANDRINAERVSDGLVLKADERRRTSDKHYTTANKTVYARAVKPMEKKMVEANKRFSERLSNGQMLRKRRKR